MGPEVWLVMGLVGSAALLASGYMVGRSTLTDDIHRLEERQGLLLAQIEDALARGEAGVDAAKVLVRSERRLVDALAGAGSSRERLRLLLEASGGEGPGGSPTVSGTAGQDGGPG